MGVVAAIRRYLIFTGLTCWIALFTAFIKFCRFLNIQPLRLFLRSDTNAFTVINLQYSPFGETVHWTLDYTQTPWKEWTVGVLFFSQYVKLFSLGKRKSVPLTILPDCSWIGESSDVVKYLARHESGSRLIPNSEAMELVDYLSDQWKFGSPAIHLPYGYLFSDSRGLRLVRHLWTDRRFIPFFQRMVITLAWPYVEYVATQKLKWSNPDVMATNSSRVEHLWEKVNFILADGRKFLANTPEPSAADIMFASLAFPLILPDAMAHRFFPFSEKILPAPYFEEVRRRRDSAAGRLVLKMYDEHRHPSKAFYASAATTSL